MGGHSQCPSFTMVTRVTNLFIRHSPLAFCKLKTPSPWRCKATMTAAQKCSFFPQEPYYIPGYGGFYPQVRYQVGKPYGRITSELLTNPEVQKSPCSVLTPLIRPKFIEDFSCRDPPCHEMMDQYQSYIPGYTGREPKPPLPRSSLPADPQTRTSASSVQLLAQRKYTPCHPGIRLACGPGWRQFASTAGSQLMSAQGDRKVLCHPDISLVCGQESRGPCDTGMSLVCGQGWRGTPCLTRTDQPTRIEGAPLPPATETVDVRRFGRTPKMDMPNLIQRKAVSGYTGFIPRFTWIMGVNYLKGVKEAMNEFDRNQGMLRSPLYSFGKRLPCTYWPNTKIYTSRGLMPFYTGFVPTIRHNYTLTFGNSTRQAYYDELQRRQHEG
ncbi:ciliary microtubule inner protein 2A isoform X2 [Rhineura floridana]|uniref:ciliary microtubule inner protein 2A isoform X2 n=1 Tax=Rhineura floridana TaxID=261503 RepID=UPI002AC83FCD|nr:ciliary microtubule inner protein 2A isoform X2 [Rhineura floridana]